jgi:hypothetical protein
MKIDDSVCESPNEMLDTFLGKIRISIFVKIMLGQLSTITQLHDKVASLLKTWRKGRMKTSPHVLYSSEI